jgi:hypothetical protein
LVSLVFLGGLLVVFAIAVIVVVAVASKKRPAKFLALFLLSYFMV